MARSCARISSLFAVDSLAGGFLTTSLLSYFFFERFKVSEGVIAALFFTGTTFSVVDTYFKDADKPPGGVLVILGLVVILLPLGLAIWAGRRRWLTWPVLAAGSVVAGGIMAWLASDDPIVRAIEALDFLHNLVVTDRPDLPLSPDSCWRTDTTVAREGLERLLSGRSDL